MKPGYKTTEFWLTLAGTIFTALVGAGVLPSDFPADKAIGGAGSIIMVVAYIISRTKVKAAPK